MKVIDQNNRSKMPIFTEFVEFCSYYGEYCSSNFLFTTLNSPFS